MTLTELAKTLNERFGALAGGSSTDFVAWDWDGLAAAYGKSTTQMLEDLLYTLVFNVDRFAYRIFAVLAARPGESTTAMLLNTMKKHRKGAVRALAARTLGEMRVESALTPIIEVLWDTYGRYRKDLRLVDGIHPSEYAEMVDALVAIGGTEAARHVLQAIAEDPSVDRGFRTKAEDALRRMGSS